jgi:hypothetical protein
MPDTPFDHADEARRALHAIVSDPDHGPASLSSPQTMSNLLKDLLPDAPREKNLLVTAAENGLADKLRNHVAQGLEPDMAIRLTAASFATATAFTPDGCEWVTREIAVAMGISAPGQSAQPGSAGGIAMPQEERPFSAPTAPGPGVLTADPATAAAPAAMQPSQAGASAADTAAPPEPATVRPDPGLGYVPTTAYQAAAAPAGPATPASAAPGAAGPPLPARRRAPWFIGIGLVVAAAVVVAVVLSQGGSTPPAKSGSVSYTLTTNSDSANPVLTVKITGAIHGTGTQVGIATNQFRATLSSGTFVVTTSPETSTYSRSINHSTCAETISESGTLTFSGGTGSYSGISGSGNFDNVYTETLPRSGGACATGSGVTPVAGSFHEVISGHGTVSVP